MTASRTSACRKHGGSAWWIGVLVVAATFALPAESQRLGRFFSTPDERELLDELRRNRDLAGPEPEPLTQEPVQETVVEQLSIDGVVIRSGGANSAWVNGRPVSDGWTTREGVRVDAASVGRSGRVIITLPSGVDTIDLKPGQKIDVESGLVMEAYEPFAPPEGASVFGAPALDDSAVPAAEAEAAGAPSEAPAPADEMTREQILERIQRALGGG